MSNPTSNFNWQMPTNSDLVTDLPADFEVFGQAVDTTMADLKGGTTGQILSKATNADMDFTWIANDQGDITAVNVTSPITGGGTSGAVTVGIQSASTSQSGAVQLSDSTSTTSSVLAATSTAVKSAYDLANTANTTANAAIPKSTVTAKGSIVAATASSTPANLAVGNNGESLIADSSVSTGLRYQGSMAAGRNFVINGGFDIWQRGTSFATGSLNYFADRWQSARTGQAAGMTISRQSTNDTTNLPFIQYCARVQRDSGNTNLVANYINTIFETVNSIPLAGKSVTLSFYARAGANYSASSSSLTSRLVTGTGTDQNNFSSTFTGQANAIQATNTLTTTWQRFQATVTLASTITQLAVQFEANPTGTAGANDYFEVTGVMLEVGAIATQFSRSGSTIGGELALCQRYYYRWTTGGNANAYFNSIFAYSSTLAYGTVSLPVPMRVNPTSMDTTGTAGDYRLLVGGAFAYPSVVPALENSNYLLPLIKFTVASGLTAGQGGVSGSNATNNTYIGFSAEL